MVRENASEQFFDFVAKVKKTKEDNHLECHNDLCKAKGNCKNYYGAKEGAYRISRESCRIYAPKENVYVGKNKRF